MCWDLGNGLGGLRVGVWDFELGLEEVQALEFWSLGFGESSFGAKLERETSEYDAGFYTIPHISPEWLGGRLYILHAF